MPYCVHKNAAVRNFFAQELATFHHSIVTFMLLFGVVNLTNYVYLVRKRVYTGSKLGFMTHFAGDFSIATDAIEVALG